MSDERPVPCERLRFTAPGPGMDLWCEVSESRATADACRGCRLYQPQPQFAWLLLAWASLTDPAAP